MWKCTLCPQSGLNTFTGQRNLLPEATSFEFAFMKQYKDAEKHTVGNVKFVIIIILKNNSQHMDTL